MCAASDPPVYLPPDAGIVPKLFFYGTINHCSQQQQQKYNRNSFSLLSYFRPKQNFKSIIKDEDDVGLFARDWHSVVDASLQPPPPPQY